MKDILGPPFLMMLGKRGAGVLFWGSKLIDFL
jgi:hypothetical protein